MHPNPLLLQTQAPANSATMHTGTVLRQGAVNAGDSPVGGETYLWTAAFVAREVTLITPTGMTKAEKVKYFGDLAFFLVSISSK